MSKGQVVFLPGFDGDAELRAGFLAELRARHEVCAVSYPNRLLGSIDAYRDHAMGEMPVDWNPILIAESFSGLVATRWSAIDPRVKALVLCASFARNPMGYATELGSSMPALVKWMPALFDSAVQMGDDSVRRRWSAGFTRSMGALRDDVVAERMRLIATEDITDALRELTIPVVMLQFEYDQVITPAGRAELEAACPRARVVRVAAPHFGLAIRPRDCLRAIERALRA